MSVSLRPAIVVHGRAGSGTELADGCEAAAQAGLEALARGDDALAAAVAAVAALEDDGRYNAGAGSALRMDGETIEMDAGLMDTRGRLGAVAALRDVPNPIHVARMVADTPHWLLAGEGAMAFARALGLDAPVHATDRARERYRRTIAELEAEEKREPARAGRFEAFWNYPTPWEEVLARLGAGTVGAVVRSADGHFAVATSTGGSMPALFGRVGDTPIVGCGYYAGPAGAVAATGIGEEIVRRMLCRTVYGWIEDGMPLQAALEGGVEALPSPTPIGLIGITRDATAVASRVPMASAMRAS